MSDILILASIVMLALLFLKVPVYIAVLGGSMVYFLLNPDINSIVFAQQAIVGTEKISLLAIPFFVCAGIFMNYTGVTKRIMNFCEVVTGRLPGGLAQVNVLLSTVMGGLSGSNIADAAMESKMLVPEMTKKGFSLEFSSVVTAASSMITPLIPPGIAMILYSLHCQCIHWKAVYLRDWRGRAAVRDHDDSCGYHFQEKGVWKPQH